MFRCMSVTLRQQTVFIVQSDPETAESLRVLLGTQSLNVCVFQDEDGFVHDMNYLNDDIVIIDLSEEKPTNYKVLAQLLHAKNRPKIILSASQGSALKPSDRFPGDGIEILFHPYAPSDLLSVIRSVSSTDLRSST